MPDREPVSVLLGIGVCCECNLHELDVNGMCPAGCLDGEFVEEPGARRERSFTKKWAS